MPLSKLDEADVALHDGKPVIFHCRSGARTLANAARLAAAAGDACEAYVVEGGIDAWRKAGLPVRPTAASPSNCSARCRSAPAAWLFWVALGVWCRPWFFAIPLLVGGGLRLPA